MNVLMKSYLFRHSIRPQTSEGFIVGRSFRGNSSNDLQQSPNVEESSITHETI